MENISVKAEEAQSIRAILQKILEGEHPLLAALTEQTSGLRVCSKSIDDGRCIYRFEVTAKNDSELQGANAFVEISDTYIKTSQFEKLLYAKLTVLEGKISSLEVGGDFDFNQDLSISEIGWIITDFNSGERKLKHSSNERNLKYAIGYIPMYK